MAKIPTSDTLASPIEELKENRVPKNAVRVDAGVRCGPTTGPGVAMPAAMHRVIVPRRARVSSPSPKMSPILSMTRRTLIPQQLFNPISLSMSSRRSLGVRPTADDGRISPGRAQQAGRVGCRTPPVPRREDLEKSSSAQLCRTPPVRSPMSFRGQGGHVPFRLYSQPSRHSIGGSAARTPPVPHLVRRSSSQGRVGDPPTRVSDPPARLSDPPTRVRVATTRGDGAVVPAGGCEPKDEAGRTQLMHAARKGDLKEVTALLQGGCFVDDIDSCKCTALMYAATYGSSDVHSDERGWTALMHVAFNGRLDILKCLLQRGALVEQEDKEGRSALVYAAFSGHLESVKLLLAYGRLQRGACATQRLEENHAEGLALMFAADKGHLEIVRAFLDAAVASVQTLHSALELATSHGHRDVVPRRTMLRCVTFTGGDGWW
eukprot:Skav231443  [mRNA]  locus=scaffold1847:286039:292264:- [translate_table: standard]